MKGLLNLLTLLAALLNLTAGCGLRRHSNTAAGILQIGQMIAGGSLQRGGAGGSVAAGLSKVLAGSSRGTLLNSIGSIAAVNRLTGGASSVTSGLGTSGAGLGLGALAAGLGGTTSSSLLTQVGSTGVRGLSIGGSNAGSGPLSSIPSSGILVRQGLQQAGNMFGGALVMATSSAASSSTASNVVGVSGSQPGGLPGGVTLPSGSLPPSNVPGSGGVPVPLGAGAGPAAGVLGGGLGVPPAGGFPGGVSGLGSVSTSRMSVSAIDTVRTHGQPSQQNGHPLGLGPLGVRGAATISTLASAAQLAGGTVGNLMGVSANPNGAGSGGGAQNGDTGMLSTGAGPGSGLPSIGNPAERPVQGVQPAGPMLGAGSFVVGTSSRHSATSVTTNIRRNGVINDMNVAQGVRQQVPQMGQPFGGESIPSGGVAIQSGAQIGESAIRDSVDIAATLNDVGPGGNALTPGRGPSSGGGISGQAPRLPNTVGVLTGLEGAATSGLGRAVSISSSMSGSSHSISGSSFPAMRNPGERPVQGVQPAGPMSGAGTFVTGSSSHQSATSVTTSIRGNGQAPRLPNTVGVLSGIEDAAASGLGREVSISSSMSGSSHSISGSGYPAIGNPGERPVQGVQPAGPTLGAGSFVTGSSSHQSATSVTANIQGNGRNLGPGFGQGPQPVNDVPSGGSIVAVTTSSRQSSSRWGAHHVVQSSGGSLVNGLPTLSSGGPGGMPSTVPSVLGSTGTSSGLLTAIVGAATEGSRHGGHGAVPGGSLGVLGSSGTSLSGSSSVISGIGQGQLPQKPHERKPSAAAAAGIALGVMAGTLALGAIGTGLAGAIQSGMTGRGRQGGGCPRRACGGGCGRKRRSILQSKVPADVLNNIPMDFNLRY